MRICFVLAAFALSVPLARAQGPVVVALNPNTARAGDPGGPMAVFGSGFVPGSAVTWNGTVLATTFLDASQLRATISDALLTAPGIASVAVLNPDGARSGNVPFTIVGHPLAIVNNDVPTANVGVPYSVQLMASGGSPPYTWQLVDSLPFGMSVSSAGVVSGTPASVGTFSFTVRVTDREGGVVLKSFALVVNPPPMTITPANLPAARLGVPYRQVLTVAGGTAPFRWNVGVGLPPGVTFSAETAALAGTPQTEGRFSFLVEATDSKGATARRNFTLVVGPPPLRITTEAPLFPGIVGQAYSQVFAASGGTQPYRWTMTGAPEGLTFDASAANLAGTPSAAGSYPLSVQVTDANNETVTRSYVLSVSTSGLSIITNATLPSGSVGVSYSFRLTVSGGTPPYTWSMLAGYLPGLRVEPNGTVAGAPTEAGSFTMVAEARDSAGLTATRTFTMSVEGARLSLAAPPELAGGKVGDFWSYQPQVVGGVPPFAWSAVGLPPGLEIDPATGVVAGAPQAPGPFVFNVRVVDAARSVAFGLYRVSFEMPPLPAMTVSGLPGAVEPAKQHAVQLELEGPLPVPVAGELVLAFAPENGPGDSMVRFASGARSASFRIPAGATAAQFDGGAPVVQTGTVAGSILLSVRLSAGGVDITPAPAPGFTARMERGAPAIAGAKVVRRPDGFDIQVTGYCTAREITEAVFQFSAAGGSTLQQAQVRVPMEAVASAWFQNPASAGFGSQFTFTQSFTVQQGEAAVVTPVSVTVTNRFGSATADIAP